MHCSNKTQNTQEKDNAELVKEMITVERELWQQPRRPDRAARETHVPAAQQIARVMTRDP